MYSCKNQSNQLRYWSGIADIDECDEYTHDCTCAGLPGCTALCRNTIGSYECSCSAGFGLGPDARTCEGKYNHN